MSRNIRSTFLKCLKSYKNSTVYVINSKRSIRGRIYSKVEESSDRNALGVNPRQGVERVMTVSSQRTEDKSLYDMKLNSEKRSREPTSEKLSSNKKHPIDLPKQRKMNFESYTVTDENRFTRLSEVVTPLYQLPYEKQLQFKYDNSERILAHLGSELRKSLPGFPLTKNRLPCDLEAVRPSPVQEQYRNFDEFSVGPGVGHGDKVVGLFLGKASHPAGIVCVEPTHLVNRKQAHVQVAKIFHEYICASPLHPWNLESKGFWRSISIKSNRDGHLMVSVIVNPEQISDYVLEKEKETIRDYLINGPGKDCNITSLFFQTSNYTRSTQQQSPFQLLHGTPHLIEFLGHLNLPIYPDTYFQANTSGAEVLYETVQEVANLSEGTTVLDVRCGSGICSLYLSNKAERCIGIDLYQSAIKEAKANCELNGVDRCSFFLGQPQKILPEVLSSLFSKEFVVIVNATRGALSGEFVSYLRSVKHIRKIIYVFHRLEESTWLNFIQLWQRNQSATFGPPFVPVKAVPVDVLPQTEKCDMVLVFQR